MSGDATGNPSQGFHDAYLLLVTLCGFNARPPVIAALLPAVIKRQLIYTTYRTLVGEPPHGRRPASVAQCLCSSALRAHSSLVLSFYARLHHLDGAARLIRTYQAYRLVAAGEELLDFNRLWFICSAFDAGTVRLTSCDKCGNGFAYDHADTSDNKRCPACALRKMGTKAAASKSEAVPAPADDEVRVVPAAHLLDKGFNAGYSLLVRLCKLSARPPVLRNLVPQIISRALILATYRTLVGDPRQGRLPESVAQCLCSPSLRLHTTLILTSYDRLAGLPIAERMIRTHEAYATVAADENLLDFNRLWFLCRAYEAGLVRVTWCRKCSHRFAYDHGGRISDKERCPVCAMAKMGASSEGAPGRQAGIDLTATRDRQRLARALKSSTASLLDPPAAVRTR